MVGFFLHSKTTYFIFTNYPLEGKTSPSIKAQQALRFSGLGQFGWRNHLVNCIPQFGSVRAVNYANLYEVVHQIAHNIATGDYESKISEPK